MKSGIYSITCLINGKIYVGSAVNIKERWKDHKSDLNSNKHHSSYLQNSWTKYGKKYFDWNIIEYCKIEELIEREQYYIDYMNPEFNIIKIAGSCLGYRHTMESRLKMSIAQVGNIKGKGASHLYLKRKFSNEDIQDIRTNKNTFRENAKEYSCSIRTIEKIRKYITYKEIK